MEPNKLENQIREKLNSREIQPSAQAWDRLDAMLSVAEEKKTKRSFGWLYIAAGILVLLSVGTFFFTPKNTGINPQNTVVGTEIKKDSVQTQENKSKAPIVEKNQENEIAIINNHQQNKQEHSIISQKTTINQKQSSNNPLINRDKEIEYQNSSDVALKDLPKIETRKEIISNSPKTTKPNSLTDEQLLASLDNSIKKSTSGQSNLKVDAKSLLSQADGELEKSFREKVIEKVSKNYKEIKVALANRNNE